MNSSLILTQNKSTLHKLFPWFVWGISSLFVSYQMLLQTSPSVMIADLENAFSINAFGVSLLASSFFYPYVLFQIPAGLLVDRIQPRYLLMVCLFGIAAASIGFANAGSVETARLSRMLQGVFSAPSVTPALYLAALWFPSRRFALIAGLTEMIGMLGSAIGQITLAPCSSLFGWRATIVVCAMGGLGLAALTWAIVRNKSSEEVIEEVKPTHKTNLFHDLLTVISFSQSWINGVFSGLLFSVSAAFSAFWCIPYLMQVYPISLNTAAAASSMGLFGVALGAPSIGWLSDRLGLRRMPMIISTAIVLVLMLTVLYVPGISIQLMFILLFALGFFSSAYALPFAVMRDIMPSHVRGVAMGYTNMMCILVGSPLLQPLIGWWLNKELAHGTSVQAYQHALVVLPLSLGIGLILAFLIRETNCGQEASIAPS